MGITRVETDAGLETAQISQFEVADTRKSQSGAPWSNYTVPIPPYHHLIDSTGIGGVTVQAL
jgi:hypothetical protein